MSRRREMPPTEEKRFAVFDIDGTVARDSLFTAILDAFRERGLITDQNWSPVEESYRAWQRRTASYDAYLKTCIELLYDSFLPGLSVEKYESVVAEVLDERQDLIYTYPRDLITWLGNNNYFILGLSGSPQQAINHFCAAHNFDDWMGSVYLEEDGHFTGQCKRVAHDKKLYLEELIDRHSLSLEGSVAVGDTPSDIAMLEVVEHPVCFNPSRQLQVEAYRRDWPLVIERKDVVYLQMPFEQSEALQVLPVDWYLDDNLACPKISQQSSRKSQGS